MVAGVNRASQRRSKSSSAWSGGFLERHERLSCRCRGRGGGGALVYLVLVQVVVTPCQRVAKVRNASFSAGAATVTRTRPGHRVGTMIWRSAAQSTKSAAPLAERQPDEVGLRRRRRSRPRAAGPGALGDHDVGARQQFVGGVEGGRWPPPATHWGRRESARTPCRVR